MSCGHANVYSHCDVRAVLLVRTDADRVAPGAARAECSEAIRAQNKAIARRGGKSKDPCLLFSHVITPETCELFSAGGRTSDTYTRPCVGSA
jgi:hypothetical protein